MKLLTSLLLILLAENVLSTAAHALPIVQITQIELNNDSARVYYKPVVGASDYRAYALENPKQVKYAGIVHLFAPDKQRWVLNPAGKPVFPYHTEQAANVMAKPSRIDVPNLNIEFNGLDPGQTVHIVVEAVNRVGPSPYSNLATEQNVAVNPRSGAQNMSMNGNLDDAMELLGSNAGPTDDGLYSINGDGAPHTVPVAIARSTPIAVRPTGKRALPSTRNATEVTFDTFSAGHIEEIPGTRDSRAGNVSYLMHTDTAWRVDFLNDDIIHSRPFIMNRHYMDVLFDGSTPGTGLPLHIAHGASAMTPIRSADFNGGRMLHITMEVDAHMDGRRWTAFNIVPANDPLTNLYFENRPINKTDTGFFCQFFGTDVATNLFLGHDKQGIRINEALCGALGQAKESAVRPVRLGYDGLGLDDRSRFDLFLTKSRYVVFEGGEKIIDQNFDHPLPASLQRVKVYFVHYLYHTGNEIAEVKLYQPWEKFWIDLFPYSDERHWDNMGFEVLPASYAHADADQLGNLITSSSSMKVQQIDKLAEK